MAKNVGFKMKIHNSKTQLSKNVSGWHFVIIVFFKYTIFKENFLLYNYFKFVLSKLTV